MFGKCLKYDFRSMFKQFAFIWPAALVLALVNHFTASGLESTSTVGGTTAGVAIFVYVAILIAMFVVALIFVIQRFYKGLLGDEGYLMHTLPVRPWQLIGSKLLVAVTTTFLSVVVALLSILLVAPWELADLKEIPQFLRFFFQHWSDGAGQAVLYIAEGTLVVLLAFAVGYLQLYLAMSIGHLFSKHRVAFSVAAFLAIEIVDRVALSPLFRSILGIGRTLDGGIISSAEGGITLFGLSGDSAHLTILKMALFALVYCAIYFAGTEFILRKKLNLE